MCSTLESFTSGSSPSIALKTINQKIHPKTERITDDTRVGQKMRQKEILTVDIDILFENKDTPKKNVSTS
ncbi:hypothetical protein D3C86_1976330 [compost metagenome]